MGSEIGSADQIRCYFPVNFPNLRNSPVFMRAFFSQEKFAVLSAVKFAVIFRISVLTANLEIEQRGRKPALQR